MPLRRFAVENYRSFRDRQEIDIHPVTVVLGRNNSGKSALIRAPLILETGFDSNASIPLDPTCLGSNSVDDFRELLFEQAVLRPMRFEMEVDGPSPFTLDVAVVHDQGITRITQWRFRRPDVDIQVEDHPVEGDDLPGQIQYLVRIDGDAPTWIPIVFRGLLPATRHQGLDKVNSPTPTLGTIRYLSSYRRQPARQHRRPLAAPTTLGPDGERMAAILAYDQARNNGRLRNSINETLARIVPGWSLDEVDAGPLSATVLTRASHPDLRVNLVDAGSGLTQMLPVIAQCAFDHQFAAAVEPALQIVEEPEMHLHPAAHAELADLYLRTAQHTGARFLIETHSETLLLRLRRRIAEGEYPADTVGVYVVRQDDGISTVTKVDIDELGNLGAAWPDGYFSQDYHEVRAMAAAQVRRSGDVA